MAFERQGHRIPLHVKSFLTAGGREIFSEGMTRVAGRDPSRFERIGEQKLYEEPDEVIKRYLSDGFDIVKAMKEKPESFLWVRAMAIVADTPNENGDFFPYDELTRTRGFKTASGEEKMPAYKTFEGCRIYTNHKNDDVAQAKGLVVHAELDEEKKCVWCTFYVDSEAYPDIARGIQQGYITDVSMGTQVEWSECSVCDNKATKESEWCLTGDALITMGDGSLRRIDEVSVGDVVLSHRGVARTVTATFQRDVDEEVLVFTSPIMSGPLTVTKNHPMWAMAADEVKCKRCSRQKCRPGEVGVCWSGPKTGTGRQTCSGNGHRQHFDFVEAKDVQVGDFVETPRFRSSETAGSIGIPMAKLAGYYLAEGSVIYRSDIPAAVSFDIAQKELSTVGRDILDACGGCGPSKYAPKVYEERAAGNSASIRWTNRQLTSYLVDNFGTGASEKRISADVMNGLNDEEIMALVGAVIDGDGYQSMGARNGDIRIDLVSRDLVNQLALLLRRLGIRATTFSTQQKGGPTSRDRMFDIHCLAIPAADSHRLAAFCRRIQAVEKVKRDRYVWTDNGCAAAITSIEPTHFVGTVYNLEVEGENSYVANGVSVHNCDHLKKYKGKRFSGRIDAGSRKGQTASNELVYEINHDLKFIELSIVSDGAFRECEIDKIMLPGEVVTHAEKLRLGAADVAEQIHRAQAEMADSPWVTPSALEVASVLSQTRELMGRISEFSGRVMQRSATMEREAAMSVLDTLNDVLNKIEAVIVALLTRKDTIDLTHVAKLSKAMADIQQEVSDMIDDGLGTMTDQAMPPAGGVAGGGTPNVAGQPAAPAPDQQYAAAGPVGQAMMPGQPMQGQPQAGLTNTPFQVAVGPNVIPGGVSAASSNGWVRMASGLKGIDERLGEIVNSGFVRTANTDRGGKEMTNNLFEVMGNKVMTRSSQMAGIDYKQWTEDEKYMVVISSKDGSIRGYVDGQPTTWTAKVTTEEAETIKDGRPHVVAERLLNDFVRTAAMHPVTPTDVQEHQLETKRAGNPDDVQEHQLEDKRDGNPDDVQEHQLEDRAEKGKLGRAGNPTDVQEHQLEIERDGNPDDVQEHQLAPRRAVAEKADRVVSAMLNAVAKAVCDSKSCPSDALDALEAFAADIPGNMNRVASAANRQSHRVRVARREREEFGLAEAKAMDIDEALVERIADVIIDDPDGANQYLPTVIKHIASSDREKMRGIVGTLAGRTEAGAKVRVAARRLSLDDMIRGALNAAGDDGASITAKHLIAAIKAASRVIRDLDVDSDRVLSAMTEAGDREAVVAIEAERLPEAIAARKNDAERLAFWKQASVAADDETIRQAMFGALADESESMSSRLVWEGVRRLTSNPTAGRELIDTRMNREANGARNAAVSMTDRTSVVREMRMHVDDINSPMESADYEDNVRRFAISYLQDHGYQVDPETFQFTRLSVNENTGEICATIESTVDKTLAEGPAEGVGDEGMDLDMSVVMTPTARANRRNLRQAMLRSAQGIGGGMPTDPMAGGAAPAADPMAGGAAPAAGEGDGIMGFGAGPEEGEGEEPNLDNASMPGEIKPIGSICPQCGSNNVELASGRGECGDCGTSFELKISLENIQTPEEGEAEGEAGAEGEEAPAPEGLGAALAPPAGGAAPAAPAAPAAGGMPALAASIQWYSTDDAFVKLASDRGRGLTDEQIRDPKPIGACVVCGNRSIRRANSQYFCDACDTIGLLKLARSKRYPGAIINTLKVIIPA